jgi:AcrR family transcriptional regulator
MSTIERPTLSVANPVTPDPRPAPPEEAPDDAFGGFAATWEDMLDEISLPSEISGEGPMTKWDIRRIKTRGMILHAGREVFATRGPESPKVEDVARAAGISRAGFYLHFKSLEELMLAVFRREIRWQLRRYRTLTIDILRNDRKFRGWLERFFASFRQERDYMLIIYRTLSTDPSVMEVMFQEHDRMLLDMAQRIPQLGLLHEDGTRDARMFARMHNLARQIEDISLYSAFNSWGADMSLAIDQICEYIALIQLK